MTQPQSVNADGSVKVLWVETIANPSAPTVGELTAGSVLDLSCYLTADGYERTTDEQTITDDRLCSRATYEQPGRYQDTAMLKYVYNMLSAGDDEARLTLTNLNTGYLVERWGQDFEDDIEAGDTVDVLPVKMGIQKKNPPTANTVLSISQKPFITGPVRRDVTVAA